VVQRLESRLKEREAYAAELEGRIAESEKHKQNLREAVEVTFRVELLLHQFSSFAGFPSCL
jgi:hypothetical protein